MGGGDFLDACLALEERYFESGYQQGRTEGRVLGRDEGRILGIKEGWDLGFELGIYLGIAEVLRSKLGGGNHREATAISTTTNTTMKKTMNTTTASERKLARLLDGVYESLMASSLGSGREVVEGNMQRGDVHPRNDEMQAYVRDVRTKLKLITALVGEEDRRRIEGALRGGDRSALTEF